MVWPPLPSASDFTLPFGHLIPQKFIVLRPRRLLGRSPSEVPTQVTIVKNRFRAKSQTTAVVTLSDFSACRPIFLIFRRKQKRKSPEWRTKRKVMSKSVEFARWLHPTDAPPARKSPIAAANTRRRIGKIIKSTAGPFR